ncbi:hypothetical protein E3Q22_02891 [Wallemia mellicola]|uniref:Uncharacterized protein n=1 Tax=Wallemia mellicola TaxID=1708541 RepID=A0A4V4MYZ7_9BASI|nr:hypothetical protein E3Q23_02523 [Wallemia mellicola]TIB77766.1 hypothetical protein E3Q22_02891 [Wallemia mellicola]TIB91493.1 hypothetical protein E3Q19_02415 [Wallemia mellicola]TIB99435.1 hypothetical protein E3Q17_02615 [Wallemia mellicola]TIC04602.1 hypothetical protein E3Q16_02625 [Wallemia mellicola]
MTDTPVTKRVQNLVRTFNDVRLDGLSLVLLFGGIFFGLWQSYTDYYNLKQMEEAKHVFCRLRYKKHYADWIVAQPDKLINRRFRCLVAIALSGLFKVLKTLFVYHKIAIAIDIIKDHVLYAEAFAVLAFSLDIAYLQELSESPSDPVENDLESKSGHSGIEQIMESTLSVQAPSDIPMSGIHAQVSVNTLVSQPISSDN